MSDHSIVVKSSEPTYLKLNGIVGSFETPGSNFAVKYFCTFANNRVKNSDYHKLLKELKPMRERVDADDLDDLSALLQRDLDDSRVAQDLVPYLLNTLGDGKHIAFFPSILAILMPSKFLDDRTEAKYPIKQSDSLSDEFSECWKVTYYRSEKPGERSELGRCLINLDKTDIIVLDGQHRSNAFRVLANTFKGMDKEQVYSSFYSNINQDELPDPYKADLPVTLIWFEFSEKVQKGLESDSSFPAIDSKNEKVVFFDSEKSKSEAIKNGGFREYDLEVEPQLISRKLFVDVNNQSRRISESRTILLNDREPVSLLTKSFYSKLAREGKLNAERLSLLHCGFDIIADGNKNPICFTNPEIIKYSFEYFFFGTDKYDALGQYKAKKEMKFKVDTAYFERFMPTSSDKLEIIDDSDGYRKLVLRSLNYVSDLEHEFNEVCASSFYKLIGGLCPIQHHVSTVSVFDAEAESGTGLFSNVDRLTAWNKLYKGGEGLYYLFKDNDEVNTVLRMAIREIDEKFYEIRHKPFREFYTPTEVKGMYNSIETKAFQCGLIKALQFFYLNIDHSSDSLFSSTKKILERLNKFDLVDWGHVLIRIKPLLVGHADPKQWPSYRNLFIRLCLENDDEVPSNYSFICPEAEAFKVRLYEFLKNYSLDELDKPVKEVRYTEVEDKVFDWIKKAEDQIVNEFKLIQSKILEISIDFKLIGEELIKTKVLEDEEDYDS